MLKELFLYIPLIMFLGGLMKYIYNLKHLLCMLISLSMFLLIYLYLNSMYINKYFLMVFLTFAVCEGALGISLLIKLVHNHGYDYMSSLNFLKC